MLITRLNTSESELSARYQLFCTLLLLLVTENFHYQHQKCYVGTNFILLAKVRCYFVKLGFVASSDDFESPFKHFALSVRLYSEKVVLVTISYNLKSIILF